MSLVPLDSRHLSSIARILEEVATSEGTDQHQRLYIILEKSPTGSVDLTTTTDAAKATPLHEVASTIELFARQLLEYIEKDTSVPSSSTSSTQNISQHLEISNNDLACIIHQITPLYSKAFSKEAPACLLLEKLKNKKNSFEALCQHLMNAMDGNDLETVQSILGIKNFKSDLLSNPNTYHILRHAIENDVSEEIMEELLQSSEILQQNPTEALEACIRMKNYKVGLSLMPYRKFFLTHPLLIKFEREAFSKTIHLGDIKTLEKLVHTDRQYVRNLVSETMTEAEQSLLRTIASIASPDLKNRICDFFLEEGFSGNILFGLTITSQLNTPEVLDIIRRLIANDKFLDKVCHDPRTILLMINAQHKGPEEYFQRMMSDFWDTPRLNKALQTSLFSKLDRAKSIQARCRIAVDVYNQVLNWGFSPLIELTEEFICNSFNIDLGLLNFLRVNQSKSNNINEAFLQEAYALLSQQSINIASSIHLLCSFPSVKDHILANKLPEIWHLPIDWQNCPAALASLFGNCSPSKIQDCVQKLSDQNKLNLIEACVKAQSSCDEGYARAKHELALAREFAINALKSNIAPPESVEQSSFAFDRADLTPLNLQESLHRAYLEGNPIQCRWLLSKGADLAELNVELNPALFQWLSTFINTPEVLPKNLDHFALHQGMGYKTANLMVLDQATTRLNREGIVRAAVPHFLPISDVEIHYHLHQHYPALSEDWNTFLNTFSKDQVERFCTVPSSNSIALTEAGKAVLQRIQENIAHVFNEYPFDSPLIREWLAQNGGHELIVRSTGKEDSDALANAGGNASIPCVHPDLKSISSSIGTVIASYFSQISLNQRLMGGDTTLFIENEPFMPVLIQAMVMEERSEGAAPLRSGVAFSSPFPSLPLLMKLQVAYGNNQGVVEGSVEVDTFQVLQDDIRSIIREKRDRYVHEEAIDGSVVLSKTTNEQALVSSAALPRKVVEEVARFINDLAYYYGDEGQRKSLDIEFSIKYDPEFQKYVFYLLQARPLVAVKDAAASASYLDPMVLQRFAQEYPNDIIAGDVLLAGNSSCQTVTSPEELLIAPDLFKGLQIYLASTHKSSVKAILCFKNASETSHPAVEFRATGLPVLILPQALKARIESLITQASSENPLKVSVQNPEVLVSTRNLSQRQRDLLEKSGMITFPGIAAVSIPEGKDLLDAIESEGLQVLKPLFEYMNRAYPELKDKLLQGNPLLKTGDDGYGPQQLLQIIATASPEEAKQALASLLFLLQSTLNKSLKEAGQEKINIIAITEMLLAFVEILKQCEQKLIPLIEHSSKPSKMEFLYQLQFVKALVFQRRDQAVNALSFHSALEIQRTSFDPSANSDTAQVVLLYKKKATSAFIAQNWQEFVLKLQETSPRHVIKLYEMLKDLDALDLSRLWISILFKDSFDKDTVTQFVDNQEARLIQQRTTLDRIKQQDLILKRFHANVEEWESPDVYAKQVDGLIHEFSLWFSYSGGELRQLYENAEKKSVGRLAVLQFIQRAIATYDKAIKAVTGSTEFTEAQKLEAFANLLIPYRNMMETCLRLIPKMQSQMLWNIPQYERFSRTTDQYLQEINEGIVIERGKVQNIEGFYKLVQLALSGQCTAQQFSIRPHFSVHPMTIGSKACLVDGVIWPEHLEEYFTVFHQNMVTSMDVLVNENGLTEKVAETTQRKFLSKMKDMSHFLRDATSCVAYEEDKVHLRLNIPLGAHAATFDIIYTPLKPEEGWQVNIKAFGFNEASRWETAAKALFLFPQIVKGISLIDPLPQVEPDSQFFEAAIHIDSSFKPHDIDQLANVFAAFADGLGTSFAYMNFLGYELL